jgi:alkylation response protein AidB-like acyl-CoA dehydrogenase
MPTGVTSTDKLAEPVVEALHKEGLYGMWVPRSLGGAELDPVSSLQVIENLGLRRSLDRLGTDGRGARDRHWCRVSR